MQSFVGGTKEERDAAAKIFSVARQRRILRRRRRTVIPTAEGFAALSEKRENVKPLSFNNATSDVDASFRRDVGRDESKLDLRSICDGSEIQRKENDDERLVLNEPRSPLLQVYVSSASGTNELWTKSELRQEEHERISDHSAVRKRQKSIDLTCLLLTQEQQDRTCQSCGTSLELLGTQERQLHLIICSEDELKDPTLRRNYHCPICDANFSTGRVSDKDWKKRISHLKHCQKIHGIHKLSKKKSDGREAFDNLIREASDDCDNSEQVQILSGPTNAFDVLMSSSCSSRSKTVSKSDSKNWIRKQKRSSPSFRLPFATTKKRQRMSRLSKQKDESCVWKKKVPTLDHSVPMCKGFVVDSFKFEGRHFFLSHFHADHYQGITKEFNSGIIYCSLVTSLLLQEVFKVPEENIRVIKAGGPKIIVEGVEVEAIDANHCPGALMFFFTLPKLKKIVLHCGDMRYDRTRVDLRYLLGRIPATYRLDRVFVDTTFCNPRHAFISQQAAINLAIKKVKEVLKEELGNAKTAMRHFGVSRSSLRFFFGSYNIGKERLLLRILDECFDRSERVHVCSEKWKFVKCLIDAGELKGERFTKFKQDEIRIHLVRMDQLTIRNLKKFRSEFGSSRLVAFHPTGWTSTFKKRATKDGSVVVFDIPYSEHSSFSELSDFVEDVIKLAAGPTTSFIPTVSPQTTTEHLQALVRKHL